MIREEKPTSQEDLEKEISEATGEFVAHLIQLPLPPFANQITEFNKMYGMPSNPTATESPGFDPLERMKSFKKILQKEVNEIDEIINAMILNQSPASLEDGFVPTDWLTMLADLLGDITVYARSEGEKYGIPSDNVLNIIMESNFSKMGADGNPIYDDDGKLEKGPNYWKPEPRIKEMMQTHALVLAKFNAATTKEEKMAAAIAAIKSGELERSTYGAVKSSDDMRERMAGELKQIMGLSRLITSVVGMKAERLDTDAPAEETGVAQYPGVVDRE